MSLTHIETIELGSSQSSITFSSIPQDYDDLVVLIHARTDRAGEESEVINLEFNGTYTNLSSLELFGTGSGVGSNARTSRAGFATGAGATANTFSSSQTYISNYTAATAKSFSADTVTENNATTAFQAIIANLWNDTSAVTSIRLFGFSGGSFVSGTTASLYGITAGGDGTVSTA